MTISTDYFNIYSAKTSHVLLPLKKLLRDSTSIKSFRISSDYLYEGGNYSASTRYVSSSFPQTHFHQIQKDYRDFMRSLTKDKRGLKPCRIVISVTFKSTANQWKQFTVDLGPKTTYDLEYLDHEVIELLIL